MTSTATETRTFTLTHARYVTSKIAADLDLLRVYHGRPSEYQVTQFAEEAALYIAARYLASVEYGFRRNGVTVLALKYEARSDGTLTTDDRPGRVYYEIDVSNTDWYSYLITNHAFMTLPQSEQNRFEATLPLQRTAMPAPVAGSNGYWEQNRTYSSNGEGVLRRVFRPL